MGYQLWSWSPVKPRKGEVRWKNGTVSYMHGTEGDKDADLRYVRKMEKVITEDGDGTVILGAAVNGNPVTINDREWMNSRAALEGKARFI